MLRFLRSSCCVKPIPEEISFEKLKKDAVSLHDAILYCKANKEEKPGSDNCKIMRERSTQLKESLSPLTQQIKIITIKQLNDIKPALDLVLATLDILRNTREKDKDSTTVLVITQVQPLFEHRAKPLYNFIEMLAKRELELKGGSTQNSPRHSPSTSQCRSY